MTTPGPGTLFPAPGPALAGPHLDPGATEVILFEGEILAPVGAVPGPATTVTGPDAYGDPAVVGTDTTYAREDHDHGLPDAPAVASPLQGAGGTGDATGGAVTFEDASGAAGGAARLAGGHANTHSDRPGGYVNTDEGTAFYGGFEAGIGGSIPILRHTGGASALGLEVVGGGMTIGHAGDAFTLRFPNVFGGLTWIIENIPTADPHVVGHVWSDSGVLTISAG